jgi:hypothetical protein
MICGLVLYVCTWPLALSYANVDLRLSVGAISTAYGWAMAAKYPYGATVTRAKSARATTMVVVAGLPGSRGGEWCVLLADMLSLVCDQPRRLASLS